MSWLLVACIPGLLMLATLGLGRLESALANGTVTANDVAEFLEQADAEGVSTLARQGMPEALNNLHRRRAQRIADAAVPPSPTGKHHADSFLAAAFGAAGEPDLRANPRSKATRDVNRV